MKKSFIVLLFAVTVAFLFGTRTAEAISITYTTGYGSDPYGPLVQPDWNIILQLPKFDSALGTLTGVTITNSGEILGSIGVENKNVTSTRSITAELTALLEATLPGGYLVTSNPTNTQDITLPKFDGVVDYAGTSGTTLSNLTAFDTVITFVNAADLALFTGGGLLDVPVAATDASYATGGGNTASNFSNAAGLILSIQYDYNAAPVPEPSSFILLGAGLVGVAVLRRKKRQG